MNTENSGPGLDTGPSQSEPHQEREVQHYIETVFPGVLFGDFSEQPIESRDVASVRMPKGAVGFRFFSRTVQQADGEALTGVRRDISGWHYLGKEICLEEAVRRFGEQSTLVGNMRCNGWRRVVLLPNGQAYQLRDEDVVMEAGSSTPSQDPSDSMPQSEGPKASPSTASEDLKGGVSLEVKE